MRNINRFIATLCLLTAAYGLLAQPSAFTVLYINSLQGATYSEEGGNERRIFAGVQLPVEGRIRLKHNTEARLLYENKKITLQGPGMYALTDLKTQAEQEVSSGFLTRFWSFISNSIKDTDSAEQVEKYHRRYLTNVRAGINGFAEREYLISAPLYLSRALDKPDMVFRWDSVAHPYGYHFTIRKQTEDEPLFSAMVQAEQLSVRLDEIRIKPAALYTWQVSAVQSDSTRLESSPYPFIYLPDAQAEVAEFKDSFAYRQLKPEEKELYVLYQLEQDGLLHSAYRRYLHLSNQDQPEADIYRKLFVSFLARMNALSEAKSLVK